MLLLKTNGCKEDREGEGAGLGLATRHLGWLDGKGKIRLEMITCP